MKPKILSKMKHDSGLWEIVVLSETLTDGKVKYHYTISASHKLNTILSKPLLTYSDWHFIQQQGRLTHKDLPPEEK